MQLYEYFLYTDVFSHASGEPALDLISIVDYIGEAPTAVLFGLLTGLVFGIAAQRSAFCLRASAVEFARRQLGSRMSVWLLAFSTAVAWTQLAELSGLLDAKDARIMAIPGSISGAVIGGLMFGVGMILAKGCSGRMLVLAATGNLRSVVSGLVFTVFAQMALRGGLSPVREALAGIWITPNGTNINLIDFIGAPQASGLILGLTTALIAIFLARKNNIGARVLFMASGVGFAVALGWALTAGLAQVSFEPVTIESATFSGPSANLLMDVLTSDTALDFDLGLLPGVFLGAFFAAWKAGELKFQGFEGESNMRRAMTGAALMGFGAMLAGGCAIGNGLTGASIFTLTAWLALTCMWIGAALTDYLVDGNGRPARSLA